MRSRLSKVIVISGAALVAAAVGFRVVAVPNLVRFPLNVDETAHYSGVALTYVDPTTGAPRAAPLSEPLTIDRRVRVVSGSARLAVVRESITATFGSNTSQENYQFVMDRRTMRLVDDPRQFAFDDPANRIHAAGTYRINWPMGTTASGRYDSYVVETDHSGVVALVRGPHRHPSAGVNVVDFGSAVTTPVAPYYLAHLRSIGLPMELSASQVAAQLQASGVDIGKALADVGPRLTPADQAVVTAALSRPVPLQYFYVVDGTISVEPRTGALVNVHANHEGLAVTPDLTASADLTALLQKYVDVPSVKAASDGLAKLAAQPPAMVEDFQYAQTAPSAAHLGAKARSQIRQLNLVEFRLPWIIGVMGMILAFGGVVVGLRRRTPPAAAISLPAPADRPVAGPQRPAA